MIHRMPCLSLLFALLNCHIRIVQCSSRISSSSNENNLNLTLRTADNAAARASLVFDKLFHDWQTVPTTCGFTDSGSFTASRRLKRDLARLLLSKSFEKNADPACLIVEMGT